MKRSIVKKRMFPHSVTIYNVQHDIDKTTLKDVFTNYITILKGVLVDASKAVNVQRSGLEGADSINLYIPFDVEAVDGITGEPKTYLPPMEFWRSTEKIKHWSLTLNGQGDDTFFIKGVVIEPDKSFQKLSLLYDDVYDITKIDTKDMGKLPHWQVGAA